MRSLYHRVHRRVRLDGESWESDKYVENKAEVSLQDDFEGWNAWKDKLKQGQDCAVIIERQENSIRMRIETLSVAVSSVTAILDGTKNVFVALTGDRCAITDIHIDRKSSDA